MQENINLSIMTSVKKFNFKFQKTDRHILRLFTRLFVINPNHEIRVYPQFRSAFKIIDTENYYPFLQ